MRRFVPRTANERGTATVSGGTSGARVSSTGGRELAAVMAVFARGNVFSCGKSSEMPRREERKKGGRKEGRKEGNDNGGERREMGRRGGRGRAVEAAGLELGSKAFPCPTHVQDPFLL